MHLSRRRFVRWGALSTAWAAAGFPAGYARAAATPPVPEKIRVAFFTDVHARPGDGVEADLRKAAAEINARRADLLFGGGDYVHGGYVVDKAEADRRWAVFEQDFYRRLDRRPRLMVGNHDHTAAATEDPARRIADPKGDFLGRFGMDSTYYHFEYAGVHFIVLDSIRFEAVPTDLGRPYWGQITAEQLTWLDGVLADLPERAPVILCSHIPFMAAQTRLMRLSGEKVPESLAVPNAAAVLERFGGRSNPLFVLQGHLHRNERLDASEDGQLLRYAMGGAVCGAWWRGPNHGTQEGFAMLTLSPEGVGWEYVDVGIERQAPQEEAG